MSEFNSRLDEILDAKEISISKLDDLNVNKFEISDGDLIKLLDKHRIGHGPILETTRTLYKRLLIRELRDIAQEHRQQQIERKAAEQQAAKHQHVNRDIEKIVGGDPLDDGEGYLDEEESTDEDWNLSEEESVCELDDESGDDEESHDEIQIESGLKWRKNTKNIRQDSLSTNRYRNVESNQNKPKSSSFMPYILLAILAVALAYYLVSLLDE